MKYLRTTILLGLLSCGLGAFAGHPPASLPVQFQAVTPGLDYAHVRMTNWNQPEPWSIHIARLDRSRKDLQLASMLSQNEVFGIAPISAQAKSIPKTTGVALAAINTDFCNITSHHPYRGTIRGVHIMQGQLISAPLNYSLWVDEDGAMTLGAVKSKLSAVLPGGKSFPIGLNHECKPNEVVLFTHRLGASTRATNHLELVLEDPTHKPLSWQAGRKYSLRVKAVNPSGDTALSNSIAVLSFGKDVAEKAGKPAPGDEVKLELATEPDLGKAVTAVGCTFPLVKKGQVLKEFDGTEYLLQKHPRTAIGFNERYFFMVVVDGRQRELSMGMYPKELAEFMALLGCQEAMNMDGGGSSTFWLDGSVRNSPSDKHERYLASGLAVVKRDAH